MNVGLNLPQQSTQNHSMRNKDKQQLAFGITSTRLMSQINLINRVDNPMPVWFHIDIVPALLKDHFIASLKNGSEQIYIFTKGKFEKISALCGKNQNPFVALAKQIKKPEELNLVYTKFEMEIPPELKDITQRDLGIRYNLYEPKIGVGDRCRFVLTGYEPLKTDCKHAAK